MTDDLKSLLRDKAERAYNLGVVSTVPEIVAHLELHCPGPGSPGNPTAEDLAGIAADALKSSASIESGIFPRRLIDSLPADNLLARIVRHNLRSAPCPQPALALGGAIALAAVLFGRKVQTASGLRSNLYICAIAPSAAGKEQARRVAKQVLIHGGAESLVGPDGLSSGSGLVSILELQPGILLLLDEFGRVLHSINNHKAGSWQKDIITNLLQLYTSADVLWRPVAYSDRKKNVVVNQPHVVLYGTATPKTFFDSLTRDDMAGGFVSRLLVFEGFHGDAPVFRPFPDPPAEITGFVRRWSEFQPGTGNLTTFHPEPQTVEMTTEAGDLLAEFTLRCHEQTISDDEEGGASIWARCPEKAAKLALIFACCQRFEKPEIDAPAMAWAIDLVEWLTARLLFQSDRYLADNALEANVNRVKRMIEEAGMSGITHSQLIRRTRWLEARQRTDILTTLAQGGEIAVETVPTSGRPTVTYRMAA